MSNLKSTSWLTLALRCGLAGLAVFALGVPDLAAKAPAPAAESGSLPVGAIARLGDARLTHGGSVVAFAFAPDGKLLASVGADGFLRIWDVATGQEKRHADVGADMRHVAWSSNSRTLALGGKDGVLRGLDAENFKELFALTDTEQDGAATPFTFTADGHALAYWSRSNVHLYDLTTKKSALVTNRAYMFSDGGPYELPTAFAVDPLGKTLAFTHVKATDILTLDGLAVNHDIRQTSGEPSALAYAPDGKILAIGGERQVHLWDPATGKLQGTTATHTAPVRALGFTLDGKELCSAADDGECVVWDLDAGKLVRRFHLLPEAEARGTTLHLVFGPDGHTLAWSVVGSNRIRLTDTITGREVLRPDGTAPGSAPFAFTPDGRHILAVSADGRPRLWDAANGKLLQRFDSRVADVILLATSADGKRAVAIGRDVVAWEIETGKELARFGPHYGSFGYTAAVSADGKTVAIGEVDYPTGSTGFVGKVRWYDVDTGKERGRAETPHPRSVLSLAFDPKGKVLASADADRELCLWDVASGRRLVQVEGSPTPYTRLAYSADGKSLLVAQRQTDGRGRKVLRVTALEADATTERRTFDAAKDTTFAAFAPDGSRIALFTAGGVCVVDLATEKTVAEIAGQEGKIGRVAFSPDATRLATSGMDGTILVWDLARTPRPGYAPDGSKLPRGAVTSLGAARLTPRAPVEVLAYSADTKLLAAADREGTLSIWDTATGSEVRCFDDLPKRIHHVAWSPDGKTIAVSGEDRLLHIVDAETGNERHTLTPTDRKANLVFAFVPDGRSLFWWSGDGVVHRYDLAARKETQTWTGQRGPAPQFAFTPDGKRLAVLREKAVMVYDLSTGKVAAEFKEADLTPAAIAFAPDGQTLAAAVGKNVHLWNLAGREPVLAAGVTHQSLVCALHYAAAGKALYSAGEDGECKEWDVTAGREKRRFRLEVSRLTFMQALAFAPDGKTVAWVDRGGPIHLTDAATAEEVRPPGDRPLTTVFAFTLDGDQLLTPSVDGSLRLWDATTGKLVRKFEGKAEGVTFIGCFGQQAVTVGKAVIVWELKTGKEVSRLKDVAPGPKWPAALLGSTLALGEGEPAPDTKEACKVHWYDLTTGKKLSHSAAGHNGGVLALAFDRDEGKTLASTGGDGDLCLWELETGKQLARVGASKEPETKLLYSDQLEVFLSVRQAGKDDSAKTIVTLHDPKTAKEIKSLSGPQGMNIGAFSPDGRRVVWLGHEKKVWATDISNKLFEYADLTGQRAPVHTVAFSRDGQRVATGSADGSILVWDLGRVPRTPLVRDP